ncbi:hypothetical protein GWN26_15925 [Candidatus Saccharibacteria bacterium]|nr:DUF1795 domain-containing protein [Candidatus Saccharibacteria bacterium]NIV04566.1 hypothetical protein [Calditrichia bacterium]NIS39110.1 DUF1795 domain-containing protein [Candidatus Saccharibacteria bacterium]NIV73167.1 hypothetical protein [Calditrichia bacterium]NIW00525.1 hypothetical protein [Candidatus Saccharibacteria bacterium]
MENNRKGIKQSLAAIFLAVLALVTTLAIFLYTQSKDVDEKKIESAADDRTVELLTEEEEAVELDWVTYFGEEVSFNYPVDWFLENEGDFVIISSWDPQVSPERSVDGLRLIIGKVTTDMTLEQYVGDYLDQNISFDPSYNLLGRKQALLGAQPAVFIQAATSLEGGSVIQSMFTFFEGEIWSVDLIGTVLDDDMQNIFDQIAASFTFLKTIINEENLNNNEETYDESSN